MVIHYEYIQDGKKFWFLHFEYFSCAKILLWHNFWCIFRLSCTLHSQWSGNYIKNIAQRGLLDNIIIFRLFFSTLNLISFALRMVDYQMSPIYSHKSLKISVTEIIHWLLDKIKWWFSVLSQNVLKPILIVLCILWTSFEVVRAGVGRRSFHNCFCCLLQLILKL